MARCKKIKPRSGNHKNQIFDNKDSNKDFFPPRYSNGFQTICDVDVHADDKINFALGKGVRHVGTGIPMIKTLPVAKGMKDTNPCLYEILMEHENVHVKNAEANCESFKKCLDDEVANNLILDTVSVNEYNDCKNANHGGLGENCLIDEMEAYQKSILEGEHLINDEKCAPEKNNLMKNIEIWKRNAKNPPNCS